MARMLSIFTQAYEFYKQVIFFAQHKRSENLEKLKNHVYVCIRDLETNERRSEEEAVADFHNLKLVKLLQIISIEQYFHQYKNFLTMLY